MAGENPLLDQLGMAPVRNFGTAVASVRVIQAPVAEPLTIVGASDQGKFAAEMSAGVAP